MEKHKTIKTDFKPKRVEIKIADLPKISSGCTDEAAISRYIEVLRNTSKAIGDSLLQERCEKKAEEKRLKKAKNVNTVKHDLNEQKSEAKHGVRKKIQKMRQRKVFPQPKSYMNYRARNGLLGKNSITINEK